MGRVSDFALTSSAWFSKPANRRLLQAGIEKEELNRVFNDVLEGQGYDVVRYLDLTFDEEIENEYLRTEYRVGGKIIDAKTDTHYKEGERVGDIVFGNEGFKGDLYLKIEWSVFDALRRTTVYKTVTEGTGKQAHSNIDGLTLMMNAAFEMAVHNLGADEGFHNLLVKGIKPPDWRNTKKAEQRPLMFETDEEIVLDALPLSRKDFTDVAQAAQNNVVMVQAGAGHGSGFFITRQGHILTNQHVVGNAARVRVVTAGKKEKLIAQVLRVDSARDVALLKLEESPEDLNIALRPLLFDWPKVSEDIYAIGAPQRSALQDTVSKGIVSAHRKNFKRIGTRQDFIQGDVPIHGGNSGGPLLDKHGNIVGISVIGLHMPETKTSADLNLFITVQSALDALNIGS